MRVIEVHASGWVTVLDFLDALKVAIGAPAWHGESPDAFIDSMIWGGINAVEPPYEIRVIDAVALPREIRDYVLLIAQVLTDARAEHRVRKGRDVNVTLTLSPHSSKSKKSP